jgi:DNA invertase Pin-like site-specific DNA recombinase
MVLMIKNSYLKNILTKEVLEKTYSELRSMTEMAKKFGTTRLTIARHMNHYGIAHKLETKYKCNENTFSIDSEISFYLAGFIAADGCVGSNGKSKTLFIGLSNKDKSHLEKIRAALGAENPIHDYDVKTSKQNPNWKDTITSQLRITSAQIYSDLQRFNITERKTHTLTFPEWIKDHPLRHHFIRGYIDGDGSFYHSIGKGRKVKQVFFSVRGTTAFLTSLRSILETDLNLEERTKEIRINNGIGVLEYGGNRVCKALAEYLYRDATIYLDRKRESAFALRDWDTKEFFEDKGISKEALEESYLRTKSILKTAKELNLKQGTVYNHLLKNNIEIFESPQAKKERLSTSCTPEALKNSYQKHGTISGVAKEFGIGKTTATRYLKSANII